ncbi:hypothetical protein BKA80DRAFT_306281 [Phyllosticta citrichinensis]
MSFSNSHNDVNQTINQTQTTHYHHSCSGCQHEQTCNHKFNIVENAYVKHERQLGELQRRTEATALNVQSAVMKDDGKLRDLSQQSQLHDRMFCIVERAYMTQDQRIAELERRVGDLASADQVARGRVWAQDRRIDRLDTAHLDLDGRIGRFYAGHSDLVRRVEALEARALTGRDGWRSGRLSPDEVE